MAKTGGRLLLKEKFVQIYEGLLNGDDPSRDNANFWDELFLLKVNVDYIQREFESMKSEKLVQLRPVINHLFYQCVQALKSDNRIRIVHSLQTLCALVQGVFSKANGDYGFDVIDLLVGFDCAEKVMQDLLETSCAFLVIEVPHSLKLLVLKFLLVLVTASVNVSNNTLLEYLMMTSVFESLIAILADPSSRQECGYDAVLLLTMLVNYRKYESTNPYIMKLSIADNELALNGFGQVVSSTLSECNRKFIYQGSEVQQSTGLFSGLSSLMGIFAAEEAVDPANTKEVISTDKKNDAVLLAMYEAVHLNRNFLAILTNTQAESLHLQHSSAPPSPSDPKDMVSEILHEPPTNLFVTFVEFTSIVMQNTKEEASLNTTKLCFIVLTCIAEDQYANSIMHDVNMLYKVHIHHMPMRHRKLPSTRDSPSRPLAGAVLDLMVEFILSHMKKNFHIDLYMRCLGVIHRLLCYQKRCRVRLTYTWKELWTALISLLKFILNNEFELVKKHNIFVLSSQIVNTINLFITYGDTFLASPTSYDELYYEIIRMNQVFDNMYSMALRYTAGEGQNVWKDSAARLANHLVNIRAIVNHFNPKINSWAQSNGLSSLTEDQVLDVVRSNYDSLTLKLHDNLDQFERYCEKPRESAFFTQMVRSIVTHVKTTLDFGEKAQHSVLTEFSTIR